MGAKNLLNYSPESLLSEFLANVRAAKLCLMCRNLCTNLAFCRWIRCFELLRAEMDSGLSSSVLWWMPASSGRCVSLQRRQMLSRHDVTNMLATEPLLQLFAIRNYLKLKL